VVVLLADVLSFLRLSWLKKILLARRAVKLCNQGSALFYGKIPKKLRSIYQQDPARIHNFPLHLYHIAKVDRLGLFYIDFFNDFIKSGLSEGNIWEEQIGQLVKNYALPGTVAIDAGAYIGTHTLAMAHAVGKSGRVYSFEPQRKIYAELCWNMAINKATNVFPMRLALGKTTNCVRPVQALLDNEGSTFVVPDKIQEDSSLQLKLDDLNLKNISLIKIDVENMEADVIEGGRKTILRCRPVLIVEIQGNPACEISLKENRTQRAFETVKKIQSLHYTVTHLHECDFLCLPLKCPAF